MKLIEIAGADHRIGIAVLEMRLIPSAYALELRRPFWRLTVEEPHQRDEVPPVLDGLRGRVERRQGVDRWPSLHAIERLAGCGRSETLQKLNDPKAGDAIGGVLCPAQHRQHVLDVRGLDELEPAELDEWNIAAR